jgi:glycosidase
MTATQRETRDAARTPMQWDASPSAGFTAEGVTPWLPFGDNAGRNVAAQRENPASTLHLVRDLIALRRTAFTGQVARYEQLPAQPGVWAYRSGPLVVTANLTDHPVTVNGPLGETLLATSQGIRGGADGVLLDPWQGLISQGTRTDDHSGS